MKSYLRRLLKAMHVKFTLCTLDQHKDKRVRDKMNILLYFLLPKNVLFGFLTINMLMATSRSLSRSVPPLLKRTTYHPSYFVPKHLLKSLPCPLWSSSLSFCLEQSAITTTYPSLSHSCSSFTAPSMASTASVDENIQNNPLLQDFDFPPFDVVEAKNVRLGIRTLLKKLVRIISSQFTHLLNFIFWVFFYLFIENIGLFDYLSFGSGFY